MFSLIAIARPVSVPVCQPSGWQKTKCLTFDSGLDRRRYPGVRRGLCVRHPWPSGRRRLSPARAADPHLVSIRDILGDTMISVDGDLRWTFQVEVKCHLSAIYRFAPASSLTSLLLQCACLRHLCYSLLRHSTIAPSSLSRTISPRIHLAARTRPYGDTRLLACFR